MIGIIKSGESRPILEAKFNAWCIHVHLKDESHKQTRDSLTDYYSSLAVKNRKKYTIKQRGGVH